MVKTQLWQLHCVLLYQDRSEREWLQAERIECRISVYTKWYSFHRKIFVCWNWSTPLNWQTLYGTCNQDMLQTHFCTCLNATVIIPIILYGVDMEWLSNCFPEILQHATIENTTLVYYVWWRSLCVPYLHLKCVPPLLADIVSKFNHSTFRAMFFFLVFIEIFSTCMLTYLVENKILYISKISLCILFC